MIFTTISFTVTVRKTFHRQCNTFLMIMLQLLMVSVRSQKLDIDNGEGNLLKDLPCVMRLNQLYCSDPGSAYPTERIGVFADDNKALLRRMFGELQVTVIRDYSESVVSIIGAHVPRSPNP